MFIMTQINIQANAVQILDTSDNSCEIVNLKVISDRILAQNLEVRGMSSMKNPRHLQDLQPVYSYGIGVSFYDARCALCDYYQNNGVDKSRAMRMAGLS